MKSVVFAALALALGSEERVGANPIRRVVNLLQAMQTKVEEEGEKEAELYEKFVCYCKNNKESLKASIVEAANRITQLETQVKEDTAAKNALDEELKNHKGDREEANKAIAGATKIREKDAATYAKESGDASTNIAALGKAVTALEKGLAGGAFLQTYSKEAQVLKSIVTSTNALSGVDRETLASFLSTSSSASTPGSSEIVGILKTLKEELEKDYEELVATEKKAVEQFEALIAAKNKEIAAATTAIEKKTQRAGELAVRIVEGKNDLEDTQETLSEDEQFSVNLRKDCAQKEKDQNARVKTRAEEVQAISETIKVLNDDDALDLFKKTLPSPKSFLQQGVTMQSLMLRARNIITQTAQTFRSPQLDLIALALKGKKADFSKILKLIDDLVVVLKEEQVEDDEHKEYCAKEFDTSDDKQKATERKIADLEHEKEEAQTSSANLAKQIKALQAGIKALDKSVVEATEQRKSEHAEYVETSAANQQALDLIAFAKNRLNKFYNPKLYKPPPPRELTEEERVYSNFGGEVTTAAPGGIAGTGIGAFIQLKSRRGAPPPPPETFGAYSKKSESSGGVLALIDALSNDLKKDMQAAEFEEKDSQEEYEELTADSQKKRAADSKAITTKEQIKAEADTVAETATENLDSAGKELYAVKEYISNLHKSCDFLVENYDFRKSARTNEIEALGKAKAVLKGADYSLIQAKSTRHLQRAEETPCVTMCRELNQYPNCQCPNFTYDKTPGHMTFDELFAKFDELIESGRQLLKDARKN